MGHQLDRQRQAVEAGEQGREARVGAVAVAGDAGEEGAGGVRRQRFQDQGAPVGEAGKLEAAQRGCQPDRGQLGQTGERLLRAGSVGFPRCLGIVEHEQGRRAAQGGEDGSLGPAVGGEAEGVGDGGEDARPVAGLLQADEEAASAEVGGDTLVVEGGDRQPALADAAGAEHGDRLRGVVENPARQLVEIGLPADQAAAGRQIFRRR